MITQYGLYLTNLVKGDFWDFIPIQKSTGSESIIWSDWSFFTIGAAGNYFWDFFRYHFRDDLRYETKYMD